MSNARQFSMPGFITDAPDGRCMWDSKLFRASGSCKPRTTSFWGACVIVQHDFPDHWKTAYVVNACRSEAAVRCILRFWAHCQSRKRWTFEHMTPAILSGICQWTGDHQIFWDAMSETFLEVVGDTVTAHEWETVNAALIARWKGGEANRQRLLEAQHKLSYSSDTATGDSDRIREDRIGYEGNGLEGKSVLRKDKTVPKVPKHPKLRGIPPEEF